jgi:hypothetical protein
LQTNGPFESSLSPRDKGGTAAGDATFVRRFAGLSGQKSQARGAERCKSERGAGFPLTIISVARADAYH